MKKILSIIMILSFNTYSQFDSLIFTKSINLNYEGTNIYPLGDQNSDGFDDVMLYDCNDERGYIFFGGSTIDTAAIKSIRFYDSVYTSGPSRTPGIAIIDLNNDSINDIVVSTILYDDSVFYHPGPIRIYHGGNEIDTLPNFTFNPPSSAGGITLQVLRDFNGDGRSELVIYDPFLPYSQKHYGTFYFYNTEGQFDTIPHYIMKGDSINFIAYDRIGSSGDINGDGKTDFTIYGSIGENPPYNFFRSFHLGNENFDLEPAVTYCREVHSFDPEHMRIINDINGDDKDDILIKDYGFYPNYYRNAILHGSLPIDTIPDVGLNTQNVPLRLEETFSLGDVNGDGYNDFFSKDAGFYPNVKLWVGGREMPYTSDDQANKTWVGTSSGFGWIIAAVGDIDGDCINDILIGERPYLSECDIGRVYIFKGDTNVIGDTGIAGVNDKGIITTDYYLYEPYPNPFNSVTNFRFRISDFGLVTLKIYDVLGREITTLINEEKKAGKYQIEFDAANYGLSSGIYFIKLEVYRSNSLQFSSSKKITLLK